MCEVEFFGRCFLEEGTRLVSCVALSTAGTARIGGLEVSFYFVNVRGCSRALTCSSFSSHQTPIGTCSYSHDITGYARIVE